MDWTGLLAAITHGATTVCLFVAQNQPVSTAFPAAKQPPPDDAFWSQMPAAELFGYPGIESPPGFKNSQVFAKERWRQMVPDMMDLARLGLPVVLRQDLTTVENEAWGIEADRPVTVLFNFLGKCDAFEDSLSSEALVLLRREAPGFPNLPTLGLNGPTWRYTAPQLNALAAHAEFCVQASEVLYREALCPTP